MQKKFCNFRIPSVYIAIVGSICLAERAFVEIVEFTADGDAVREAGRILTPVGCQVRSGDPRARWSGRFGTVALTA